MHESWCTLPKIRRGLTAGVRGLLVAARDTAHVWIWHVVFVKDVWQTYECVMLHKCEWIMTCGCVMSYIWMTDVEDENDLCHTSKCVWRKLGKFELGTAFPKGLTHKQMNACSIKLNKCLIKSTSKYTVKWFIILPGGKSEKFELEIPFPDGMILVDAYGGDGGIGGQGGNGMHLYIS